jgi:spermidine synthase
MALMHVVRIGEDEGRTALLVDGVVQSISPDDGVANGGYWAAMLPTSPPRRALILGLGGGTLARLLQMRWGVGLRLVGVDDDPAVIETARSVGWLPLPGLELVIEDAFSYVWHCAERFDYIALDLYRGERLVRQELSKPFLRRVRDLLEPSGRVAINLFTDTGRVRRLERIAAIFEIERLVEHGGNLVVHARGRRKAHKNKSQTPRRRSRSAVRGTG